MSQRAFKRAFFVVFVSVLVVSSTSDAKVLSVSVGGTHSCAILSNNQIKCWGSNRSGQLGLGDQMPRGDRSETIGKKLAPVDLGPVGEIKKVVGGSNFTCALFESGYVKCWGINNFGQLGLGDRLPRGARENQMGENLLYVDLGSRVYASDLVISGASICVVTTSGGVKCWGNNNGNHFGVAPGVRAIGNLAGQMGNDLPFVNLGDVTVTQLALGTGFQCALTEEGKVKCWGSNQVGQLGLGDNKARTNDDQLGEELPYLNFGTSERVIRIAAGGSMGCALFESGRMKCWGAGSLGFTAVNNSVGTAPNDLNEKAPFLNFGTRMKVTDLSVAQAHACVTFENGQLKCWGQNPFGALGIGKTDSPGEKDGDLESKTPFLDLGKGFKAKQVFAGVSSTCAVVQKLNEVKCWGSNNEGLLGLGDSSIQTMGLSSDTIGDGLPFVDLGE